MNIVRSLFSPPVFEDEDKTHTATLLHTLLLACIMGAVLYITVVLLFAPHQSERILYAVPILPILVGLLGLTRQGFIPLASGLLVATLWILMAVVSYTAGGVRTPAFAGFIIPILIGGFLLGRRAGVALTAGAIAVGIGFVIGETRELLPPLRTYTSADVLFFQSIYFFVSAVLLYLVVGVVNNSLAHVREHEQMLAASNRKLQLEIVERERVESAQRQAEDQNRQLFEANPHPMYVVGVETGAFLAVNNIMVEKYGYTHDEFMKMKLTDIISPMDSAAAHDYAVQFRQQNVDYSRSGPWRQLKKDGTTIFVEIAVHRMTYNGQKAIVCAAYDLTERLQAEEAVRRSEELFSKVFQDAPMGILISVLEGGRIVSMNQHGLDMIGYETHEVINQPVAALGIWYPPSLRDDFIARLRKDGIVRDQEAAWKTKNGNVLDVLISMEEIEVEGEDCILIIFNDITERKRAEQVRLEADRMRLEIVKERDVLSLKETFISRMSHEFRTPLAVILGAKESLEHYYDRMTPERRLEHYHNIEGQVRYVSSMLDEVLTLSKARSGKLQFNPTPLNLAAACQSIFEELKLTDTENHNFVWVADDAIGEIDSDRILLQHILVNLLSNAIKYSPQEREVRLELAQDGDHVVIQVSDQGIGIPEADQKNLFEPFYRASNTTFYKGTGLGLAIVKESVEAHGGTIVCESVPAQGTTFTIRLPIHSAI